jgi:hypothetical protein
MTDPLLPLLPNPDDRLQALLEASRGIQLRVLPGASVRLSRFTQKQVSRANPLKRTKAKPGRPKDHYQTRRKKKRTRNRSKWDQYAKWKHKFGARWLLTKEDWDMLWEYIGGYSLRLGTYERGEPVTLESLWIETGDSVKPARLWEGAEEKLRRLGYIG